jgi:competence protein ComEA
VERTHLAGAALVLLLAAGAGLWYARSGPEPPPVTVRRAPAEPAAITVHVSGAVGTPGLVTVPAGSRVADAIAAAGGARPGAELSTLNLAAPVIDGQQLVVPRSGEAAGTAAAGGRVAVNTAGIEDLERLPGVGPVLASRIVEHRERNGPFTVVEDLLDVPGIGEGKLAALREAVQVP